MSSHEVKILDEQSKYGKRLMSEMIFMKRQRNSLNIQSDTESLYYAYLTKWDGEEFV